MQDIAIIGLGRTSVGEHWELSLRELALEAIQAAMQDAHLGPNDIDAVIIGNALANVMGRQTHLGPLIASFAGLHGIEAHVVEAADASGGLALRQGVAMVASGLASTVLVLGVEKVTDCVGSERNAALAVTLDAEFEGIQGATPAAIAGLLMRRYLHTYQLGLEHFEGFSINAHANGSKNPGAMFRNTIKAGRFAAAPMVADPVNLFDIAPEADGAAAVIITSMERALDKVATPIRILGSGAATDTLGLYERDNLLYLSAVNLAVGRALQQSNKRLSDLEVLELHDSFTVLSALQLEAAGFAPAGEGWTLAAEKQIGLTGKLPISTFGGLKARGNPLGATGVYQALEVALQLRHEAGDNQVNSLPHIGMALNLGGTGSTAVAHVFERVSQ